MRAYGDALFLKRCYFICLSGCIVIGIAALFFYFLDVSVPEHMKKCPLYDVTGLYCPGCGGTRAVVCMFHGKFLDSLKYHAVVLYGSIIFLLFMVTHTISIFFHGRYKGLQFRPVYFYIAIGIILIQWIYKNLFWIIEGVHLI